MRAIDPDPLMLRLARWIRTKHENYQEAKRMLFPIQQEVAEEAKYEVLRMEMLDALKWVIQQRRLELSNRQLGEEWGVSHATAGRWVNDFADQGHVELDYSGKRRRIVVKRGMNAL